MRFAFLAALALACTALAQEPAPDLAGDWAGTLEAGAASLRLTLHVTKTSDGLYVGTLVSVDQGNAQIPLGSADVKGRSVTLQFPAVNGSFTGSLSAGGGELSGTWTQGMPLPLTFKRTGPGGAAPAKKEEAAPPRAFALGVPVDVAIPAPPVLFQGADGQNHLMYELHITNFSPVELDLTRIEVLGGDISLASFEGTDLLGDLMEVGTKTDDARKIGGGRQAIAFLDVALGGRAVSTVRHRLTVSGKTVDIAPLELRARAITIGPPLRGSDWMALNGPGNRSLHRRAIIPVNGHAVIAQRFAIDWVQVNDAGRTFTGDAKDNRNYRAYGAGVLAVADAAVVETKDGIPENTPGLTSRALPMTLETLAGNHIVLRLGGGNYCMYAHLQPGSLKVKPGDKVKRGQVLALLGNSGNSTEPHLHFQVMDGPSPLGSEGLPYLLDEFEVMGGPHAGRKVNALPMQNMKVKFGN